MGLLLFWNNGGVGPIPEPPEPIVDRRRRGGVMPAPVSSNLRLYHDYNTWFGPQLYKAQTHHTNPATFDDDVSFGIIGTMMIRESWTSVTCSGATMTASIIPAGALVFGVTARVTTAIEGASSFDIGHDFDAKLWGSGISIAIDTTTSPADYSAYCNTPILYTSLTNVVLTARGGSFSAGVVKLVCHYITLTAPTN